ncbi:hypothetical protein NDU88_006462 [Pleurodeles waltl]|uniref:Uncharacterized protein n=1 Tax=Pleurodeles waltl TaxID=8319 RepID=A0AAV7L7J4_PLEWA|nr:hypothetical protein NDU88_006462 [Pleurodeles waltl]
MDAACLAGNPDIRVPETVKTDDGLRAARVVDERDAERHKEGTKEGPEKTEGRPTTREPRKPVVQDRIETGEEPEERELRHVPGGTWLNQGSGEWCGHTAVVVTDLELECPRGCGDDKPRSGEDTQL